jgi:glycosyltransferase involved in cell wall biosynthesis
MSSSRETLVLYSRLAFYPVHWQALEEIVRSYDVRAVVLAAAPPADLPTVHIAHGSADPATAGGLPIEMRRVPPGSRRARLAWIARQLRDIRPDAIWVQEEPIDPFLLEMLALYRFRQRPRIVTAVCESIFPRPRRLAERTARHLLWPRLDHLIAVAGPSLEGIRAAGMPSSVPASTLVAGGLEPSGDVTPMALPFDGEDFVVGFAGRIVEEKGWRVLLQALDSLPPGFRLAVAGDGPDLGEFRKLSGRLGGRVHYAGLLPKDELWAFYAALDCLAVPSLTTASWKEQSASTLVDGLVMGLAIVASSSGGIPDMMGAAGLLVPEGDADALAGAVLRLRDEPELRSSLAAAGPPRFRREFAIPAYAAKLATALRLPVRQLASTA